MLEDYDPEGLGRLWAKVKVHLEKANSNLLLNKHYNPSQYLEYVEQQEYGAALTELWKWAMLIDAPDECWAELDRAKNLLFGERR